MSPKPHRSATARVAAGLAALGLMAALGCAHAPWIHRYGHPVHVSEVVALSQQGVPPDAIIAKMNRGGLAYNLSEVQYTEIRTRGVTPQVITYMKATYSQAVEAFPRAGDDPGFGCWYLGPDGHWYGGGPLGFHPDC